MERVTRRRRRSTRQREYAKPGLTTLSSGGGPPGAPLCCSGATEPHREQPASLMHQDFFRISEQRREGIRRIATEFQPGRKVALSTHINADGDGCGSETALARMLAQHGMAVHIVNPTAWPDLFDFLLADDVVDRSADGPAALNGIDLLIVLDISDVKRLGGL